MTNCVFPRHFDVHSYGIVEVALWDLLTYPVGGSKEGGSRTRSSCFKCFNLKENLLFFIHMSSSFTEHVMDRRKCERLSELFVKYTKSFVLEEFIE